MVWVNHKALGCRYPEAVEQQVGRSVSKAWRYCDPFKVRLDSVTSSLTYFTWQVGLTANKASLLGIEGDLRAAEAAAAAQ